jgi:hypothetical protein
MRKSRSTLRRATLLNAFEEAQAAQTQFWATLSRLEELLGRDLDGTIDLSQVGLDTLLASKMQT